MSNSAQYQLALAILEAASIRESSYDKEAAEEATGDFIDFNKFYMKSISDAAKEANTDLSVPVFLLLTTVWSDAIDWATEILDSDKTT